MVLIVLGWTGPADTSTDYGQVNWVDAGGKHRVHVLAWDVENEREVPRDPETGRKLLAARRARTARETLPEARTYQATGCEGV